MIQGRFCLAITFCWLLVATVAFSDSLFLRLLENENSSEDFDSKLEDGYLMASFNFDDDNGNQSSPVIDLNILENATDNTVPLELTELKKKVFLEDNKDSITSNETKHTTSSKITKASEEEAVLHFKDKNHDNTLHSDVFGKDTTKDDFPQTKKKVTARSTEKSEEVGFASFINFCFDMIATLIKGIMGSIMSIGEPSPVTTTNLNEAAYMDYSQNPSRTIRKRDAPETEPHQTTDKVALNIQTDVSVPNTSAGNQNSAGTFDSVFDLKTNEPPKVSFKNKVKNDNPSSEIPEIAITLTDDTEVKDAFPANGHGTEDLTKTGEDYKGNKNTSNEQAEKDLTTLKTNYEQIKNEARSSTFNTILNNLLQETTIKDKKLEIVGSSPDDSTKDNSLNDFINKESDPKLVGIIEKHFTDARLYPQPREGEYHGEKETSAGTILIVTAAVLAVMISVSAGIAAAYKYNLINIGRARFGNPNLPSQRATMT